VTAAEREVRRKVAALGWADVTIHCPDCGPAECRVQEFVTLESGALAPRWGLCRGCEGVLVFHAPVPADKFRFPEPAAAEPDDDVPE
jgi:hypothetical protein